MVLFKKIWCIVINFEIKKTSTLSFIFVSQEPVVKLLKALIQITCNNWVPETDIHKPNHLQ